jgi:hypothetical protein
MKQIVAAALVLSAACSSGSGVPSSAATGEPMTLAIVNGRIWTGDPARPWAEALVARGAEIAIVGGND